MRPALIAPLLVLALAGCSAAPAAPAAPPSPEQSSATPVPTETPDAEAVPVDAAPFATVLGNDDPAVLEGVDFDSADGTLHCGIFDPFYPDLNANPWFGCMADSVDFEWPVLGNDGESDIHANAIVTAGDDAAAETWISDVSFAGQDPIGYPNVHRLEDGTSLTWSSVTCTAENDAVTCLNADSEHGFMLSRSAYRLF